MGEKFFVVGAACLLKTWAKLIRSRKSFFLSFFFPLETTILEHSNQFSFRLNSSKNSTTFNFLVSPRLFECCKQSLKQLLDDPLIHPLVYDCICYKFILVYIQFLRKHKFSFYCNQISSSLFNFFKYLYFFCPPSSGR